MRMTWQNETKDQLALHAMTFILSFGSKYSDSNQNVYILLHGQLQPIYLLNRFTF